MRSTLRRLLVQQWWQPRAGGLAGLLRPLSWMVARVARARRRRAEDLPRQPARVPVIVVGNVIVGGAGKTPSVIALATLLREEGWTPGIVTRGYGRRDDTPMLLDAPTLPGSAGPQDDAARVGDEPLLMHRRTGAPVAIDRVRPRALRRLLRRHPEVDVVIADDGLQHHALARDIELVVFDSRGLGNGLVLPAGPLREPVDALWPSTASTGPDATRPAPPSPARFVLLNGPWPEPPAPALPAPPELAWSAHRSLAGAAPLAAWAMGAPARPDVLHALRGRPMLAAAGIAEPERFFRMLEEAGLTLRRLPLADHAAFDTLPWPPDTPDVLITEKDAVKLAGRPCGPTRVWVVTLDFSFPPGLREALRQALHALPRTHSP